MDAPAPRTDLATRLTKRLAAARLSANEASDLAGLGLSYANDILAGRSRNPGRRKLSQLAKAIGCEVGDLLGDAAASSAEATRPAWTPRAGSIHRTLPPEADGFFVICRETSGPIPLLPATPGAYAIVVPDRTMEPRYDAGAYVVAAPDLAIQNGGFALVVGTDGRAKVRRVDALLPEIVRLSALDGSGRTDMPRGEVLALHRIVSAGEMP